MAPNQSRFAPLPQTPLPHALLLDEGAEDAGAVLKFRESKHDFSTDIYERLKEPTQMTKAEMQAMAYLAKSVWKDRQERGLVYGVMLYAKSFAVIRGVRETITGPLWDLLLGSGPWVLSVGLGAAAVCAVVVQVDGVQDYVRDNFASPEALTAVSTLVSFLVASRAERNLTINQEGVGMYARFCGTCVSLAAISKALFGINGESAEDGAEKAPPASNRDTNGLFSVLAMDADDATVYQTTRFAMVVASLPLLLRNRHAGFPMRIAALPLSRIVDADGKDERGRSEYRADLSLAWRMQRLVKETRGTYVGEKIGSSKATNVSGVQHLEAAILILNDYVIAMKERKAISGPEVTYMLGLVNALLENANQIEAMVGYSPPRALSFLLTAMFVVYFAMLVVTNLAITNGYNAIWIAMLVAFTTASIFGISERSKNPFLVREGASAQRAHIAERCAATVATVKAIHVEPKRLNLILKRALKASLQASRLSAGARAAAAATSAGFNMRFEAPLNHER